MVFAWQQFMQHPCPKVRNSSLLHCQVGWVRGDLQKGSCKRAVKYFDPLLLHFSWFESGWCLPSSLQTTEPMRLILPGHITAFPLQRHFVQVTTISVFDIFVSLCLPFGGVHPSTHGRHRTVYRRGVTSTPSWLPCPLRGFSYKQRAVCHEHAGTLAAPWLICWWTCPVLISLWMLLVSSFAEGLCKRQLTKQWECCHYPGWLICIGQCVGAEQDLGAVCIQSGVHYCPAKQSLCRLGGE